MAKQPQARDALQMLADDHRTVEALFEKYDNARSASVQAKIVRQICEELVIHAMVEEQVFYPAVRDAVEGDMMDEAQVEHDSAKALILSLMTAEPGDKFYEAKVSVLKEQVEHHVYEEERQRGSMFAQVRKAEMDLDALGQEMAALKKQLQERAKSGGLPKPEKVRAQGLMAGRDEPAAESDPVPGMAELHAAAGALLEMVDAAGMTLVTAESCTGGFLASLLTDIEGLSHSFDRGFVTYSNDAKQEMLGIDPALIARSGAVSEPVARAMAQGSLERSRGSLALAITGIAGAEDPEECAGPGVTFVAAALPHRTWVHRQDFGKRPREDVRNLAAAAALAAGMQAMAGNRAL